MSAITRRADYAVRLLLELANLGEQQHLPTRELCRLQGLPYPFARRIITELSAAGLVITQRGSGGGARLARPARSITVLDVVSALGEDVSLAACVRDAAACDRAADCALQRVWGRADEAVEEYLRDQDLASLADSDHSAPPVRKGGTPTSTLAGHAGPRPVVSLRG
jgi:Rrf2 family protein